MKKATPQQLESCARLSTQEPNFLALLRDRLDDHRKAAVNLKDEVDMRWAQGKAQETAELIKMIEEARNHL